MQKGDITEINRLMWDIDELKKEKDKELEELIRKELRKKIRRKH